jgi:hypothetical protein
MEISKEVFEALGHVLHEYGSEDLECRFEALRENTDNDADWLEENWRIVTKWFDAYQDEAGTDFILNFTERMEKRDAVIDVARGVAKLADNQPDHYKKKNKAAFWVLTDNLSKNSLRDAAQAAFNSEEIELFGKKSDTSRKGRGCR